MDASRFDALAVTRSLTNVRSRRGVVSGLMLGTLGLFGLSDAEDVAAKDCAKIKDKKRRIKCRKQRNQRRKQPKPIPQEPVNACAGKNWCVDRTQLCGPADGYGKCLVTATGGNICAEVLFQVTSCNACGPASCTNCQCVLAAGGADRCNNGATGYDFICVRAV